MELIGGSIIGFIHVMAAVVVIGGSFFMNFIFNPSVKDLDPSVAGKINQAVGLRFTAIVWISLLLILVTGLIRVFGAGTVTLDTIFTTSYGQILVAKIGLFVVTTVFAVIITANGKKIGELAQKNPMPTKDINVAEGKIKTYSRLNLNIGIVIILLAVFMRFVAS